MKLEPECIGCIFNQVLKAFRFLKPDVSRDEIITVQKKLMEEILKFDKKSNVTHYLGKTAYGIISEFLKDEDPYRIIKKRNNKLALKFYDDVKKKIENANNPLFEAIIASAIGNTIDLASQHEIDLVSDIENFNQNTLIINDYSLFKESLKNANHLLIIGDNAGEIVFDKLLISIIIKFYPDLEVIYSVRSAPIINDATMEDAKSINLTKIVQVVKSGAFPGIDIDLSPEIFKQHFYKKGGVILTKGQGNFESLYDTQIPNKDVYYLLKVKCNLLERIFNAKIGDLIFQKKT
ncbi:MAG: DUF89 domain-containing protein [Candidatus Thorarchaeota archaeon]